MQKIRDKIEKTEVSQQKKKYQQNVQFFFHGNVLSLCVSDRLNYLLGKI